MHYMLQLKTMKKKRKNEESENMKSEFVKCKCCSEDIPSEKCELAAYRTVIDGKQYLFCCKNCAKEYEQKKTK